MSASESSLPKQTVPKIEDTNNVQVEDIRRMLFDTRPRDYAVTSDFLFSDAEIMDAIRRANEEFNSLPPTTLRVDLRGISDQMCLKYGACYHACLTKAFTYGNMQVKYASGGTTVDMYGPQIEAYTRAADRFHALFKELALSIKRQINMRRAYGTLY